MLEKPLPSPDDLPDKSSVHVVTLDDVLSANVIAAVAYWRRLKGTRLLPARSALSPRDMARFLRDIALIRVIDDGADYEYRLVGDAHVEAFGASFAGVRLSEIEATAPEEGKLSRGTYEHVRSTREPLYVRGWMGNGDAQHVRFAFHETAFLPLGESEDTVDHILVVSYYLKRLSDERKARKPGGARSMP